MRVIAGKARRLASRLYQVWIQDLLQTGLKRLLFNILQPELLDCRFLDLFQAVVELVSKH